jgi:hypothetical protein
MFGQNFSTIQTNEEMLSLLAMPANSGLLLLIDQLIKKAKSERNTQRIRSCKLAENLLSNYKKTSIIVTPTQEESPIEFVQASVSKALEIISNPDAHHGIIHNFASNLLTHLSTPADLDKETREKLINAWKDFSTHWLRDEIHRVARLTHE